MFIVIVLRSHLFVIITKKKQITNSSSPPSAARFTLRMSASEANSILPAESGAPSTPAAESCANSTPPSLDGCDDDYLSEFDEVNAADLSHSHTGNTFTVGDEDVPKKIDVSVSK